MDEEKFFTIAKDKLAASINNPLIDLKKVSELLKTRLETLNQIPELVDLFDELPEYENELYEHKKMKTNLENSLDSLVSCLPVLESLKSWDIASIHDAIMALIEEKGIKNGQMLWPIRTALSGKPSSPGGAFELAEILGKEETIKRIKKGIKKLN
ncbi:Glutamate--tRNA ligase [bioreactor metagenome]|uniref:Glutamate--tRNA ligase n=1 Tax=bioreactor metagenome TaxID=1076179 RepID=A0A645INF8_9ZZZZ